MYSKWRIANKYVNYYLSAKNGKGHGMHSPFVFNFINNVLNDKREYYCFNQIEQLRQELKTDRSVLQIQDFGAGSRVTSSNTRPVASIAKTAVKPRKYSQLFFRLAHHFKARNILELGTSLGITTSYLASASPACNVITHEGAAEVAEKAKANFKKLGLNNINLVVGNFDSTLGTSLASLNTIDLAYVDGNHRKAPTLNYFDLLLNKSHDNTVLVFDDIHWSREMEEAWSIIKQHNRVTTTIDLFFIGLVFFRKENKEQQHFSVRY